MASEEELQQGKTRNDVLQESKMAIEMLTSRLQDEEDRWKETTFAHCCHLHRLQHENFKKQGTSGRGVSVEKSGPSYIEVLHATSSSTNVTPTVRFRITRELRAANLLDFAQYVYSSYLSLDLASLSLSSKKLNKVFNTKTKHVLMGEALKDFTTIGGSHHPVFHMSVEGKEKNQQQTTIVQSKGLKMSQKEALCVEGDIQRINGNLPRAVSCYCGAYEEDPLYVIDHLKSLPQESLENVVELVDFWGRSSAEAAEQREEYGVSLTPEQLSAFILSCPASLIGSSSCARISQLFKEKKYQEVIEKCSAILEHQPDKPLRLYLDRGLAALLARKRDRVVAADFIKAFLEDENELKEYMLAQKQHLPRVLKVLHRCASLDQPKRATSTEDINKWQSFVIDCGKIILLFDPYDGKTLTRCATLLADLGDFKGATEMWTNMLKLLRGQESPSKGPMIDTLVARAFCHFQLGKLDYATTDLIAAVNIDADLSKTEMSKNFAKEQLKEIVSYVVGLGRKMSVCVRKEGQTDDGNGDQVRAALQLFKLVLALQPNNRKVLHACAECHTFLGEHQEAADIYDTMLQNDTRTDTSTLCSRALSNLKAGHLDIAMSDLNIAFDRNPNSIDALCARAYFFLLKGQEDDLIEDVLKASFVSVKDASVSLKRIPVPDQAHLNEIIIKGCQTLLHANREDTTNTGDVAGMSVKEKTEAVLRLTDLLQLLSPGTEGVHLLRAHAHMELGNEQEAQRILLDKVKSNPQDPISSVHLALLRFRLGKVQEAVQGCITVLETQEEATFHAALADVPDEDRQVLLRSSQQYGFSLLQQSQEPAAINTAVSAFTIATLTSDMMNTTALMARAECHAHLGSYQAAAQDYSRVLGVQTECSTALCARGCMNIVMNKQQEAVEDFLSALRKDSEAARTQILLLQQQMRLLLLYWLHLYATDAMSQGQHNGCLEDAVLIGHLLISIDADVAAWQLLYADSLIIKGDLDQAFVHLNRVLQLTPDDRSVLARRGLIYVKKGNYQLAATELSPLAELDSEGLEFVLKALDSDQRDSLVKVSLKKAEVLTGLNDHEEALCYLTLAVAASQSSDVDVLRQRTKCLSRLQQYDQALHDINLVIKKNNANKSTSQVSDYCWRGYINLLRNKEHSAVVDYVHAFKTDRQKTVSLVTSRPGKNTLAQVFHRYAEHQYKKGKTEDTIAVCQLGLLLDGTNEKLRSLKMKAAKDQAHAQCTIL
ncbi:TTC34 [Branchiostoma lanceolatum]|uniref:TTC34 protein n=1 Tax=Branchiostoma lanceolatum TaxID=7740 RepID=A0A8K0EHU6_BRALA|nr:TTC34 [Branchiostoma lanceolatum]